MILAQRSDTESVPIPHFCKQRRSQTKITSRLQQQCCQLRRRLGPGFRLVIVLRDISDQFRELLLDSSELSFLGRSRAQSGSCIQSLLPDRSGTVICSSTPCVLLLLFLLLRAICQRIMTVVVHSVHCHLFARRLLPLLRLPPLHCYLIFPETFTTKDRCLHTRFILSFLFGGLGAHFIFHPAAQRSKCFVVEVNERR